ncbi:MAG: energy transducer TonB [Azoarcus sp.]|jgi:protein TonB|nr:energy transducer TonB [Azoarcus sp.]
MIHPKDPSGPLWLALALLLHGALFYTSRLWSQDATPPRVEKIIQASLIEIAAPAAAPAPPAAPPPPKPEPPKPRPKPKSRPKPPPRPIVPEPVMVEREIPEEAAPETPAETSADPVPAQTAESRAAPSDAASGPAAAQSGAPLVEARYNAAYLRNPKPPYPAVSRRMHEEGTAHLRVYVLPDGSAAQVEIHLSSGYPRLDETARTTVRQWRFIPARRGDQTVASWVVVPITFEMESP